MHRKLIVGMAVASMTVAAWAGDAWKEKSYKEWNEQEANKILTDSPWARTVIVPATWRGSRPTALAPDTQRGGVAGQLPETGEVGTNRNAPTPDNSGANNPEAVFVLRWSSARTTRQALARMAVLRGTPEADVERLLQLPVTEHQFVLFGPDMQPFTTTDEMGVIEKSFIKLKTAKQKIPPSRVEIRRSLDGKTIVGAVFYFPMRTSTGAPLVAVDEKGVEFECSVGGVIFRQNFEPQKMVSKAGPDWK